MAALAEILLVLLPFALYFAWRRFGPAGGDPSPRLLAGLFLGVGLLVALGMWYAMSRSLSRDEAYVPARLGPDGAILHPQAGPGR